MYLFFFSSRRRHTRSLCDWSSDVCSSDLGNLAPSLSEIGVPGVSSLEIPGSILCEEIRRHPRRRKKRRRSEERRVGKERRCVVSMDQIEKLIASVGHVCSLVIFVVTCSC